MASSTTKKVLVRRFDRETIAGFVNPQAYLQHAGLEVLSPSGSISFLPYLEVKAVIFVKEFDAPAEPSKLFNSRPKMEGLWVRMNFRDGDVMEGVLPNNLVQWDREGYLVVPPEPYSNHQKLFVPRGALTAMHVLGVVGSPLKKRREKASVPREQGTLFD